MEILNNLLKKFIDLGYSIVNYINEIGLFISDIYYSIIPYWWLILIGFFIIWLINKYTDKDIFGLRLITGEFGSGKTYNLSLESIDFKNGGLFLISNIPNSFVDLKINSSSDVEKVFTYLLRYAEITNHQEFIEFGFRPIAFNLDEAHKYFFSRNFKKTITPENLMILTQIRKRSILMSFITQELAQLDIFIRRLIPIVRRYYSFLGFIRRYKDFYLPDPENINLRNEEEVEKVGGGFYLAPTLFTHFSAKRRQLLKEKWVSKFIVGFKSNLDNLTFTEFLLFIYPLDTDYGKGFWEIYKKIYGDKKFD